MDRKANTFESLSAQRTPKQTPLLVWTKRDRKLGEYEERLFKTMRKGVPEGVVELSVEELSRRMKSGRVTTKSVQHGMRGWSYEIGIKQLGDRATCVALSRQAKVSKEQ